MTQRDVRRLAFAAVGVPAVALSVFLIIGHTVELGPSLLGVTTGIVSGYGGGRLAEVAPRVKNPLLKTAMALPYILGLLASLLYGDFPDWAAGHVPLWVAGALAPPFTGAGMFGSRS